jgi:hypothetical protein
MKVRIVSVNVPARQLDVSPVELLAKEPKQRTKSKARKKQTKKKRKNRK